MKNDKGERCKTIAGKLKPESEWDILTLRQNGQHLADFKQQLNLGNCFRFLSLVQLEEFT